MAPSAMTVAAWTKSLSRRPAGPVLAGRPRQAARPSPRSPAPRPATCWSSAAATADCGPRCSPRNAIPQRDVVLLEGREVGWAASGPQRRLLRRLPHPRPGQRPDPLAGRDRTSSRSWAPATSTTSRTAVARYAIDCDFERTGEIDVATEPHQARRTARLVRGAGARGPRPTASSSWTPTPSATRSTPRPSWPASTTAGGVAMLHPAKLAWGLKRACRRPRRPGLRAHPRPRPQAVRRRHGRPHPVRHGPRPPGRPRHQHLPDPGQAGPPVHRPGLRLRADDRAADRRPARRRSAGRTARASATRRTSSTTSGSPPTTASCGAATTRSTRTAAGCAPSTTTARRRTRSSPGTSSPASRSWRASASATPGAARSTPAPASRRSSAPRTRAGSPTRPATRASASGATRFGADVMLDLLAGERTERTALEMVRRKPLPFPPEPFALDGHRAHQVVAGARGRARRPPQPVAEDDGPAGPGLRQLSRVRACAGHTPLRAREKDPSQRRVRMPPALPLSW